jgi:hypothetical protein
MIGSATKPPIQRVPEALSSGVKRPRREADHLPPSSAEFKNGIPILLLPIRPNGGVIN